MTPRSLFVLCTLVPATAFADVAPDLRDGSRFVNHAIAIQNLDAHPGYAIVVYDAPQNGLIGAHRIYSTVHSARHVLTQGDSWRSREHFAKPRLHLMPLRAAIAWQEEVDREIARQEEACFERREGCVHESRFFPRYAPPASVTSCGVEVELVYELPGRGSSDVVDTFRLITATNDRCRLQRVGTSVASRRDRDARLPLIVLGLAGLICLGFARRRKPALA